MLSIFLIIQLTLPCLAAPFKVITHVDNPVQEISKEKLRDYFLKKDNQWPDGTPVRFFDRSDGSSVRRKFINLYLDKTQRELESYWISQKFSTGLSAPTQLSSDSMVSALVSRFPGSIGYVTSDFPIPHSVKEIKVR